METLEISQTLNDVASQMTEAYSCLCRRLGNQEWDDAVHDRLVGYVKGKYRAKMDSLNCNLESLRSVLSGLNRLSSETEELECDIDRLCNDFERR